MSQNKQVIIFVSDDNYIDHVKALAVNCIEQGKYTGDFAVICPFGSNASKVFAEYGFHVLQVGVDGFLQKFYVFHRMFKEWEQALYLDCDILIQDDLQRLFSLLDVEDKIWMDTEDGKIIEMFFRDEDRKNHEHVYQYMTDNFPHVNTHQTFNSAFILFRPSSIEKNVPDKLIEIQDKIHLANDPAKGGTDQQTMNLLLWHQTKKIPNKLVCFWGLAEPQNDVDSEWRQYKKGDVPVAIHYCRWYAPWIKKTPDMDAYKVHKLDIPCNELYLTNLSNFDSIFKK